jgi:cytochrome c nitrite reductase small subunit
MDVLRRLVSTIQPFLPTFGVGLVIAAIAGAVLFLAGFTLVYAQGYSYLSDDPSACANCHVMTEQFDGWNRSPHHAVATCNDCHTPHDSIVSKYAVKALNGFNHSRAFTFGGFEEPIRITSLNRDVTQQACIYCHETAVGEILHPESETPTDCLACHEGVGHGK